MRRPLLDLLAYPLKNRIYRTVPVLMYHHIRASSPEDKLSVSPESFARQMQFLKREGYRVISLSQLIEEEDHPNRWRPHTVALTFDDGFHNFIDHAVPVLWKYGFSATIFLITSQMGKDGYLSWSDINDLIHMQIDFGSHTVTHQDLVSLDDEALEHELTESKRIIEHKTKRDSTVFSYPMGRYDERVRDAVIKAGYRAACTTNPRQTYDGAERYQLKRIKVSPTSDKLWVFRGEISGYYQWFKEARRL
jgi:peptidoglycan/xylan/chitin deacetylase (PgdA/CDA1 family)